MALDFDYLAQQKQNADKACERLANAQTPFVRNCWYVAARADEIGTEPFVRTLLGSSVLLFRKRDGTVVALQNRCCHRSFPLAEGRFDRDRDTITCGYHGLTFDCTGRCIGVPMQEQPPRGIGVRSYAVVEKAPLVWIWGGDPASADPAALPHPEWLGSAEWDYYIGYLNPRGSYVHLHENLLDLSHLSFLHATTFGTPEYAVAPCETRVEGMDIEVWRHVECRLPAIYARPLGWEGMRAMRHSGSRFVTPGLHVNTGMLENLELPPDRQTPQPMIKVAQLLTPEAPLSTHYYYCVCRNFAVGDRAVTEFMFNAQMAAFGEDAYALERLSQMQAQEDPEFFYEISIPTDRAGLAMRQHLKRLADAERAHEPRRGARTGTAA